MHIARIGERANHRFFHSAFFRCLLTQAERRQSEGHSRRSFPFSFSGNMQIRAMTRGKIELFAESSKTLGSPKGSRKRGDSRERRGSASRQRERELSREKTPRSPRRERSRRSNPVRAPQNGSLALPESRSRRRKSISGDYRGMGFFFPSGAGEVEAFYRDIPKNTGAFPSRTCTRTSTSFGRSSMTELSSQRDGKDDGISPVRSRDFPYLCTAAASPLSRAHSGGASNWKNYAAPRRPTSRRADSR